VRRRKRFGITCQAILVTVADLLFEASPLRLLGVLVLLARIAVLAARPPVPVARPSVAVKRTIVAIGPSVELALAPWASLAIRPAVVASERLSLTRSIGTWPRIVR
jgi:hypothetical protein